MFHQAQRFALALTFLALAGLAAAQPPAPADSTQPLFTGALMVDAQGGGLRDRIRLERLLDEIQRAPFDEIHLQVRAFGDAYYDSAVVPLAYGVTKMVNPGQKFDPLAATLRELKGGRRPRKVYAWLELLRVANKNRAVPEADNHVARVHSEWLSRNTEFKNADADGNQYLEPGLEEVKAHLEAVVTELVTKYELDGILLDGVRYPGREASWGYHTGMIDAWRAKTGQSGSPGPDDPAWVEMRRNNLSDLVERLSRAARAARPGIRVAVAALADGEFPTTMEEFVLTPVYQGALQDWPGWMKSKFVDAVYLENFRPEGEAAVVFDGWNYFAGMIAHDSGADAVSVVLGADNISIDALAQMKRTQETGLAGAGLATLALPSQDANSKEIFFRALANSVFSETSRRKPFEALPPDTTASSSPVVARAGTIPVDRHTEPAASGADTMDLPPPPVMDEVPDENMIPVTDSLQPATEHLENLPPITAEKEKAEELIRPRREALEYLRRRFKNIF